MKNGLVYALLALMLFAILAASLYLEFGVKTQGEFFSFNDGSVECMTIQIKKNSTKEELAQALAAGRAAMLGEIGNTPGCVNYEFASE